MVYKISKIAITLTLAFAFTKAEARLPSPKVAPSTKIARTTPPTSFFIFFVKAKTPKGSKFRPCVVEAIKRIQATNAVVLEVQGQ